MRASTSTPRALRPVSLEVRLLELRDVVAFLHGAGQALLVVRGQQADLADLAQVHADRVVDALFELRRQLTSGSASSSLSRLAPLLDLERALAATRGGAAGSSSATSATAPSSAGSASSSSSAASASASPRRRRPPAGRRPAGYGVPGGAGTVRCLPENDQPSTALHGLPADRRSGGRLSSLSCVTPNQSPYHAEADCCNWSASEIASCAAFAASALSSAMVSVDGRHLLLQIRYLRCDRLLFRL